MKENTELNNDFSSEVILTIIKIKSELEKIKNEKKSFNLQAKILDYFSLLERTSFYVKNKNVYLLCKGAILILQSTIEKKIVFSLQIKTFLLELCKKIQDYANFQNTDDVLFYVELCTKVSYGEIIDFSKIFKTSKSKTEKNDAIEKTEVQNDFVNISKEKIENLNYLMQSLSSNLISAKIKLNSLEESSVKHELENSILPVEQTLKQAYQTLAEFLMLPITPIFEKLSKKYDFFTFFENNAAVEKDVYFELENIFNLLFLNLKDFFNVVSAEIKVCSVADKIKITVNTIGVTLNFEKIKSFAENKLFYDKEKIENLSNEELASLIFKTGFTLPNEMGLENVLSGVEKLKGQIKVESSLENILSFVFLVPKSSKFERGLFILSGGKKLFFSSHHIKDVVSVTESEISIIHNQRYINYQKKRLPLFSLASLFEVKIEEEPKKLKTILIAENMENCIGIEVFGVLSYVNPILRKFPSAFNNFLYLRGVVQDENFDLIPVLNVPVIMEKLSSLKNYEIKKINSVQEKQKKKVLVVDDSDSSCSVFCAVLKSNDFLCDFCYDGIEALEKLKKEHFDIVVSDSQMPRMNGLGLLQNARRLNHYKNIPFVVFRDNLLEEEIQEYKDYEVTAFFEKKDFSRGAFISLLKEI